MKIKIVKSSHDNKWYNNFVGQVFETYGESFEYGESGKVYLIVDNAIKFVQKNDVEVIS